MVLRDIKNPQTLWKFSRNRITERVESLELKVEVGKIQESVIIGEEGDTKVGIVKEIYRQSCR